MTAVSDRAVLPEWAVIIGLLALSPLPLALPSGIALAAIGLIGSALLLHRLGRFPFAPAVVHGPSPRPAPCVRSDEAADLDRMGSDAG